jgi:hypothetical protein
MSDNQTPETPKKNLSNIQWVLVGVGAVIAIVLANSFAGANSQAPEPTNAPGQVSIDPTLMGGYCEQVLTKTSSVLDVIGINGSPGSSAEIDKALKETGDFLTGLSSSDLGGAANRKLVNSAGQSMLNILEYFAGNSTEADLETNGNLLADSYNSMTSVCTGATVAEPVELPLSGECDNVNRYLNRAVQAMGTAGTNSTIADVVSSLKENGDILTGAFDAEILGSQENWDLVRGAGEDLLKIRVGLLDDKDIKKPSDDFTSKYETIQELCSAE